MNRELYRYIIALILAVFAVVFVHAKGPKVDPPVDLPADLPAMGTRTIQEEPYPVMVDTFYPVPLDIELQAHIINECSTCDIDPAIIFAMIDKESDFRSDVIGDGGESFGLLQIKQKFHQDRMDRLAVTDLLNPYQNVVVAIDYLEELRDRYDGNMEMALMGYNAGPNGAYKYWFSKGIYSNGYSQEVLENSKILTEGMTADVLQ